MEEKKVQLKLYVSEELKKSFAVACKNQDTTAAQEIRKFMRSFIAKHGQQKLL